MSRFAKLSDQLGVEYPLIQAPMAGAGGVELAVAVAAGGGLGSLPCAMLSVEQIQSQFRDFKAQSTAPVNLNFFCHQSSDADAAGEARWRNRLQTYYAELGVASSENTPVARTPFDEERCTLLESLQPEVVSFHFGLPSAALVARLQAKGMLILSSATTVSEALYLAERGVDAIIAQGSEAGGHRGMFLHHDIATQVGSMALIPQVVDAVDLPVIAAGGISDARGIVAARALGASGVQMGSAFLRCPEARISALHRSALDTARPESTALTNLFSGKPARGVMNRVMQEIGPMSEETPVFPTAGAALAPLKTAAEAKGQADFSSLWSGQAVALAHADIGAQVAVVKLMSQVQRLMDELS